MYYTKGQKELYLVLCSVLSLGGLVALMFLYAGWDIPLDANWAVSETENHLEAICTGECDYQLIGAEPPERPGDPWSFQYSSAETGMVDVEVHENGDVFVEEP